MKNTVDNTRDIKVLISQLSAFIKTISEILNNSNTAETARYASYADMARIYNDLANRAKDILNVESIIYTFNLGAIPNRDDTVWPTQKRVLEQVLLSARILLSSVEEGIDFADDEFDNLENFLQFRLRSAIFQKPELEVEIQNAIESLLLGRGLSKGTDYDRESGKVEFSGKEYIPDFIVPKMSLCIEVKLLRENRKSKIIEEISADITAYKKIYNRQLFVVYDLGVIQNELEFKRDIEMSVGVKVIIVKHCILAEAFSVQNHSRSYVESWIDELEYADISTVSRDHRVYLYNAGVMMNGRIYSVDVTPHRVEATPLKDILETDSVDEHYFLRTEDMPRWTYAKGTKREKRQRRDGSQYYFSEGSVQFPESLDKPSRTMLTSESQVGRTSHVVQDPMTGRLRVLTPIECERLNGFPDDWTNTGMPERMRYFCMGNALVVPLVKRIGDALLNAGI